MSTTATTTSKMISQTISTLYSILSTIPPSQYCQSFFLFAAAAVSAIAVLPSDLKQILVDYGARASSPKPSNNAVLSWLSTLTKHTQVPHSWFAIFYVVSVAWSVFWLGQFLSGGQVIKFIAEQEMEYGGNGKGMGSVQVLAGWAMMFLQGARRTCEHLFVVRASSTSTMWVVHWVLGLGFYLGVGVGVGVGGADAILNRRTLELSREEMVKLGVAVPVFFYAWVNQYKSHKHLAGLKKYSLPTEGLFRWFVCAHYTCECLLYLSMAVATAPEGVWFNRTLVCALAFVVVNLGVTASGTRRWYEEKFGKGAVEGRWNMIPFVF
ncbi:uncharacterized protein PODANS_7_2130 [Podospora anserina S mat+]|uniref:Polyprenal reductase n=1 Tax=Podospora anserina (strain S / ATCC MYA-4624 / DSM 980 / FGSC 10383) TaxID=515849 RepID=B2AVQ6_PODAN|nr:uncharacterized protein PODANS_7_2130 [Podospora anserina S mat+]CAP68480.1 unnamed protein product [Podospora anserina S mat+]CDP31952.1 Putative protein of unknown function [Podospora anserina S mat+]